MCTAVYFLECRYFDSMWAARSCSAIFSCVQCNFCISAWLPETSTANHLWWLIIWYVLLFLFYMNAAFLYNIIFTLDSNNQCLMSISPVYMDGSLEYCSKYFCQFYASHGLVNNTYTADLCTQNIYYITFIEKVRINICIKLQNSNA